MWRCRALSVDSSKSADPQDLFYSQGLATKLQGLQHHKPHVNITSRQQDKTTRQKISPDPTLSRALRVIADQSPRAKFTHPPPKTTAIRIRRKSEAITTYHPRPPPSKCSPPPTPPTCRTRAS